MQERLAARYLRGFGPATPGDLARFAGWTITEAKAVLGRMSLRTYRDADGHLLVGSLDVAMALLSIYWSAIPPTITVHDPVAEHELDLVTEARHGPVRTALVLARGRGGFTSAMVPREHR